MQVGRNVVRIYPSRKVDVIIIITVRAVVSCR